MSTIPDPGDATAWFQVIRSGELCDPESTLILEIPEAPESEHPAYPLPETAIATERAGSGRPLGVGPVLLAGALFGFVMGFVGAVGASTLTVAALVAQGSVAVVVGPEASQAARTAPDYRRAAQGHVLMASHLGPAQ